MAPRDPDEGVEGAASEVPGFDLADLLAQAQRMQQQLVEAQSAVAEQVVEGQAGGGAVKVRATGGLEFQSVEIDRAAVDPDDVEMLQDLVLAAVRDAVSRANDLNREAMGGFGGALGGTLP